MNRPQASAAGPMSRRFDVASVRDGGTNVRIETTEGERAALAADCDLPGIDALEADLRIVRDGASGLHVTGAVRARIRQICVVSLDAFASEIDEPVDIRFAPAEEVDAMASARADRAVQEDEDLPDLPDPIVNGRIDLGALVCEILALGLDPYPRKPGVAFADPTPAVPEEPAASPFAVLRDLKP